MGRRNKAKPKAHGNGRPPLNRLAIRPRRESCRAAKRAQNTTAYSLTDARSASSGVHSPYLRHLPATKEKRPEYSDLWADGGDKGSRKDGQCEDGIGEQSEPSRFRCPLSERSRERGRMRAKEKGSGICAELPVLWIALSRSSKRWWR